MSRSGGPLPPTTATMRAPLVLISVRVKPSNMLVGRGLLLQAGPAGRRGTLEDIREEWNPVFHAKSDAPRRCRAAWRRRGLASARQNDEVGALAGFRAEALVGNHQ